MLAFSRAHCLLHEPFRPGGRDGRDGSDRNDFASSVVSNGRDVAIGSVRAQGRQLVGTEQRPGSNGTARASTFRTGHAARRDRRQPQSSRRYLVAAPAPVWS